MSVAFETAPLSPDSMPENMPPLAEPLPDYVFDVAPQISPNYNWLQQGGGLSVHAATHPAYAGELYAEEPSQASDGIAGNNAEHCFDLPDQAAFDAHATAGE